MTEFKVEYNGKIYTLYSSTSTTLTALKTEIGSEAIGFITTNSTGGQQLIGINIIKSAIITMITPPL